MDDNYLEINETELESMKQELIKNKNINKNKNILKNNKFINEIIKKGKNELNELNNNLKENIINDLKTKISKIDSSEIFNEEKINNLI